MLKLFGQNIDSSYISKIKSYLYKKSLEIVDTELVSFSGSDRIEADFLDKKREI